MAAEELKKYLNSVKDSESGTLYDHMLKIISKLVYDKPSNPVEAFEDYSFNLKVAAAGHEDTSKLRYKGYGEWNEKTRKMIERPREETEEGI
jgi:hypothetical protein